MKSNYKLKLITALVVLGFSVANANALLPTLTPTTISAENSDEWVMVQNENGIKVYFSEYEYFDGTLCLKIKFENSTNESIRFSWSLTKDSKTIIRENINLVESNKSFDFVDDKTPISIKIGETIKNFHININIQ